MKRTMLFVIAVMVMLSYVPLNASNGEWPIGNEEDEIISDFVDEDKIYKALEDKIKYIKRKTRELSKRAQEQTDNMTTLAAVIDGLRNENQCLSDMAQGLESMVGSLPARRQSFDQRLTAIEMTVAELTTESQELTVWGSTLENQVASTLQTQIADLETRTTVFQNFFDHVTFDSEDSMGLKPVDLVFTGVNVHIRSGVGFTDDPGTGLGNLIVGYNENLFESPRTGSHNLVVGPGHGYSSWGGFVAGIGNTIRGPFASIGGGSGNTAGGYASSISGGRWLETEQEYSYSPRQDTAQ